MKKKILILGNNIKEYAIAKKLSDDYEIFVAPHSDTIKEFATTLDIREDNVSEILEFVLENDIDLTIPVSLKSLNTNIVDIFNEHNLTIFAPDKLSAEIILDKAYAKKVLYKLRIPTPKFGIFEKQNAAIDYIRNLKNPFVLKTNASNSATIFTTFEQAKKYIDNCFIEKNGKIIIEDYVYGIPFAFYTITDGYKALPIGSSILYKHSLEGDGGQLTSGMGACSPNYKLSFEHEQFLMENVIYPTLDYLNIEGNVYTGILGVNGIITQNSEIVILGWQNFMQDADANGILNLIDDNLYDLISSCIIGSFSDEYDFINQKDEYALSVTLACSNVSNETNVIEGLDNISDDCKLSFSNIIKKNRYLEYETNNGSNFVITSFAPTISSAKTKVYSEINELKFSGMKYRKDICKI